MILEDLQKQNEELEVRIIGPQVSTNFHIFPRALIKKTHNNCKRYTTPPGADVVNIRSVKKK